MTTSTTVEDRVLRERAKKYLPSVCRTIVPARRPLPRGNFQFVRNNTTLGILRTEAVRSKSDLPGPQPPWQAAGVRQTLLQDLKAKYNVMYGFDFERTLEGPGVAAAVTISPGAGPEEPAPQRPRTESPSKCQATPEVLRPYAPSGARRYTTPATPRDIFASNRHLRSSCDSPRVRRAAEMANFSKLPKYSWQPTQEDTRLPHVAPDTSYRNTYGTTKDSKVNFKLTMPKISCKRFGTTTTFLSGDSSNQEQVTVRGHSDKGSKQAMSEDKKSASMNSRRLLDRLHELEHIDEPFLEIRPHHPGSSKSRGSSSSSRSRSGKRAEGQDGMLYSEVKKSIRLFKQVQERVDNGFRSSHERPLRRENGKYRPFSKTLIQTPNILDSHMMSLDSGTKGFKSADTYMQYAEGARMSGPSTHTPPTTGHRARNNTTATHYGLFSMSANALRHVTDHNLPTTHEFFPSRAQTELSMDTMATRGSPCKDPNRSGVSPRGPMTIKRGPNMGITGRPIITRQDPVLAVPDDIPSWASRQIRKEEEEVPSTEEQNPPPPPKEEVLDSVSVSSKREVLTVDVPSVGEEMREDEEVDEEN